MGSDNLPRWEQFYGDDPSLSSITHSVCAENAAGLFLTRNTRRILDLGCGTGRDSVRLSETGSFIVGADAAWSGLALARQRSAGMQNAPSWVRAASQALPFDGSTFDGVYCFGLLHEFVGEKADIEVAQTMNEIRRVTRPGGLVVLAVLAGDPEAGLPHVRLFSNAMFLRLFDGFKCIERAELEDLGCTGRADYKVHLGLLENCRQLPIL